MLQPHFRWFSLPLAALALLLTLPAQAQQPKVLKNLNVVIKRLDQLNSRYEETNMCVTPNGQTMYFMSDRGGQPWSIKGGFAEHERYDGDIWRSQKAGDSWGTPSAMGPPLNSGNGEDEPNVLADGQTVIFQSWIDTWELDGGPYYMSRKQGNGWSRPMGIGGGINRFFREKMFQFKSYGTDGVAISPDGNTFVMACGADYFGNMDLYMSKRSVSGQWSYPRRLSISTPKNERSVFFGADGNSLYFSSNGHGGFGGLDIFKTTLHDDGTLGPIINLGAKFNTLKNDYGFIIVGDGTEAYFVRNGDIYQAIIKDPPAELLGEQVGMVVGTITNASGAPLKANLKLVDAETGQELAVTQSDPKTGKYSIFVGNRTRAVKVACFTGTDRWGLKSVKWKSTLNYSEKVIDFRKPAPEAEKKPDWSAKHGTTPEPVVIEPNKHEKALTWQMPPEPETPVVVHNEVRQYIYFSYNSGAIPPAGRFKLNGCWRDIAEDKTAKYLITAFGDHQGDWKYNAKLSRERAVNVARYLVAAGVPESQIVVEFYPKAFHENRGNQTLYPGIRKVEISKLRGTIDPSQHNLVDLSTLDIEVTGVRGVAEGSEMAEFHKLGEAIHKNPADAKLLVERGMLHAQHHDYDAAMQDFDKARKLGASSAKPTAARYASAIKALNKVLAINPDEAHALMVRGELNDFNGNRTAACADWNKAKALKPELLRNHTQLLCK